MFTFQHVTELTYRISDYRTMRDQALTEVQERKRAETELLKTHELLEIRIRERTARSCRCQRQAAGRESGNEKKCRKELRELVTTLNTVVDNIPEGIVLLDADYRIILANDFGRQYLGLLSGSSVGDSLTHIAEEPIEKLFIYSRKNIPHEIIGGEDIFEVTAGVIGQPEACRGIVIVIQKVTDKHNLMERINAQERLVRPDGP